MRGTVVSVSSLLTGIALLMLGNGLLGTLLSLRMAAGDVSTMTIGVVLAAYFAGLALGSIVGDRVIVTVGHIRAFAALASTYSAAALVHAFTFEPWLWGALRFIEGYCLAVVFMCTESWLNERASNETRGRIMSLYMIVIYLALGAGQFLLSAADPQGFALFAIVSAAASLALVPVALTRMPAPEQAAPYRLGLRALFRLSPLGVFGSAASGMILGAFYALGPAYAQYEGLEVGETGRFMAAAIFGGLLLQWPIGAFSDRFDRRKVFLALSVAIALASGGVTLLVPYSFAGLAVFVFVFGALTFVLYPLSVAHTNDYAGSAGFVAIAGGLILAYSFGSVIGPVVAAAMMEGLGPSGLFAFCALTALVAVVFTLWRMRSRPEAPDVHTPFVAVPRTTPQSTGLDPRAPPEAETEPVAEPMNPQPS